MGQTTCVKIITSRDCMVGRVDQMNEKDLRKVEIVDDPLNNVQFFQCVSWRKCKQFIFCRRYEIEEDTIYFRSPISRNLAASNKWSTNKYMRMWQFFIIIAERKTYIIDGEKEEANIEGCICCYQEKRNEKVWNFHSIIA